MLLMKIHAYEVALVMYQNKIAKYPSSICGNISGKRAGTMIIEYDVLDIKKQ